MWASVYAFGSHLALVGPTHYMARSSAFTHSLYIASTKRRYMRPAEAPPPLQPLHSLYILYSYSCTALHVHPLQLYISLYSTPLTIHERVAARETHGYYLYPQTDT